MISLSVFMSVSVSCISMSLPLGSVIERLDNLAQKQDSESFDPERLISGIYRESFLLKISDFLNVDVYILFSIAKSAIN